MKAKNSIEKPGWELIGKFLSGETSPAETDWVETWAAASEHNRRELNQSKLLFNQANNLYRFQRFDTNKAWEKVQKQISPAAPAMGIADIRIKASAWFYRYAAVLLLAFLLGSAGYFLISYTNSKHRPFTEIASSEMQVVNEYVLPDGSKVSLNSNSRLQYPEKFDKDQREVTVTGEAFFDIKPDHQRPFVINAGSARIKVVGTSFNVNAYPEAESVEVIVESGIVQVVCCENERPEKYVELLLNAGEKGLLFKSNGNLEKSVNTNPNYVAWKTHNLIFEKTRLKEVVYCLNKTYHIEIHLKNKKLENLLLTAEFEKKPAEFILDVIRLTFDLELTQENNTYILSEKSASNL